MILVMGEREFMFLTSNIIYLILNQILGPISLVMNSKLLNKLMTLNTKEKYPISVVITAMKTRAYNPNNKINY